MLVALDLDGCIANFTKAVCKVLNQDYDKVLKNWPNGVYETSTVLGISNTQMWKAIDRTKNFWENIELYDYSKELVNKLMDRYDVYICTSPARHPNCYSGKAAWIQKHFPKLSRKMVITPAKHLLAGTVRVLIDDSDEKINKFIEFGGIGLIVPQCWNSLHSMKNVNKIDWVMNALARVEEV